LSFAALFTILVFIFKAVDDKNIVNLIFLIAGYTYGPLLGLFSFGILTKLKVHTNSIPFIVLGAPILCYLLSQNASVFGEKFQFGKEMLLINGALTFLLLVLSSFVFKSSTHETAPR
jgi:hypothetical protein